MGSSSIITMKEVIVSLSPVHYCGISLSHLTRTESSQEVVSGAEGSRARPPGLTMGELPNSLPQELL